MRSQQIPHAFLFLVGAQPRFKFSALARTPATSAQHLTDDQGGAKCRFMMSVTRTRPTRSGHGCPRLPNSAGLARPSSAPAASFGKCRPGRPGSHTKRDSPVAKCEASSMALTKPSTRMSFIVRQNPLVRYLATADSLLCYHWRISRACKEQNFSVATTMRPSTLSCSIRF